MGNLTKDPELRYINTGSAVCEFRIAVNRRFKRNDGDMGNEVCSVDIVAWARQAETCSQYLKKGSGVFIEGRLKLDSWENSEGQKRSKHRVIAERVQFLPRSSGAGESGPGDDSSSAQVDDYGSNFSSDRGVRDPGEAAGAVEDSGEGVSYDDDVPF